MCPRKRRPRPESLFRTSFFPPLLLCTVWVAFWPTNLSTVPHPPPCFLQVSLCPPPHELSVFVPMHYRGFRYRSNHPRSGVFRDIFPSNPPSSPRQGVRKRSFPSVKDLSFTSERAFFFSNRHGPMVLSSKKGLIGDLLRPPTLSVGVTPREICPVWSPPLSYLSF